MIERTKTFLALKVMDYIGRHILIRRFKRSRSWTLPMISFNGELPTNPFYHVDKIIDSIASIGGGLEIKSLLPVVNKVHHVKVWDDQVRDYILEKRRIIIYEIYYKGIISPNVTSSHAHYYDISNWSTIKSLKSLVNINDTTRELVNKMVENNE